MFYLTLKKNDRLSKNKCVLKISPRAPIIPPLFDSQYHKKDAWATASQTIAPKPFAEKIIVRKKIGGISGGKPADCAGNTALVGSAAPERDRRMQFFYKKFACYIL